MELEEGGFSFLLELSVIDGFIMMELFGYIPSLMKHMHTFEAFGWVWGLPSICLVSRGNYDWNYIMVKRIITHCLMILYVAILENEWN